ncbi:MAG: GNAT family N-acetyltransferase [Chloroflexi bacterium]|nr:GNAT family N-acetyltransferase [Chloroflexota bacterium]
MFTPSTPYIKSLGNGFTIKSVASVEDVERVAKFNAAAFGPQEESMSRALILSHPDTRPEHWLYAEEDSTGLVVASLCLIPWRWNYAGVELRSGELGICATLENYRNRGLIRALNVRHKDLLREGGFHLSHIQGIPYFYRQFGYEYALPLEGGWEIELRQIPDDEPVGFSFRPAVIEDIPTLARLCDEARAAFAISSLREEGVWRYFFEAGPEREQASTSLFCSIGLVSRWATGSSNTMGLGKDSTSARCRAWTMPAPARCCRSSRVRRSLAANRISG